MISQTHMYRKVRKKQNVEMSLCLGARIHRSIVACLALMTVSALFFLPYHGNCPGQHCHHQ